MRNYKIFLFLFLVLNGCGNHEPKPVKQVVENNQQQINKEILDQLRDLREQTIELRNQISARKSESANLLSNSDKPLISAQSIQITSDEDFKDVNLPQHSINTAAAIGDISRVKDIINSGYDIDTKINGNTPLHNAVSNGRTEIVEYLIINGANINLTNTHGDNSLDLAYAFSRSEIIEILKSKGLKRRSDIVAVNSSAPDNQADILSTATDDLEIERKAYASIINNDKNGIQLAFDNGFDDSKRFDNLTIQDSEYPNGILPISLAVDTASVDVLESLINKNKININNKTIN